MFSSSSLVIQRKSLKKNSSWIITKKTLHVLKYLIILGMYFLGHVQAKKNTQNKKKLYNEKISLPKSSSVPPVAQRNTCLSYLRLQRGRNLYHVLRIPSWIFSHQY